MPLEYKLERGGTLVNAHATGVLTLDCFMSMQKRMKADINLKETHDTLLDARDVSQIQLTEQDLTIIAQGLTSDQIKLGANRLAIVTTEGQGFTLGERYKTVEKGVEENVLVFFSINIAKTWLGIKL